jgi:biopolymer transport protein ExbD
LDPIRNNVTLDRDGKLYWNGSFVSHQQLSTMLDAVKKLNPQPDLYLEAEMGTPCRELDQVRHEVSEALSCRDTKGRCVEGLPDSEPAPYK